MKEEQAKPEPKPTTRWAILLEAMGKGNPVTLLELDLDRKKPQPQQAQQGADQ